LTYSVSVPYGHVSGGGNAGRKASQNEAKNIEKELRSQYKLYRSEIQHQFNNDSNAVREHIATIERTSGNTLVLLQGLTGLNLGLDPAGWSAWWAGWNQSEPRIGQAAGGSGPSFVAPAAVDATAAAPSAGAPAKLQRPRLAKGTVVWTSRGKKPVESLRVGDLVLSQEPSRGGLSYQGVVAITAPAPGAVLRLRLDGGGSIVLSLLQPVWKAGEGWVHARDLKTGDAARVGGGRATIVALEPEPDAPLINVVLMDEGTLFAGERGLLVHDNGIVHPPGKPFDAVPELESRPNVRTEAHFARPDLRGSISSRPDSRLSRVHKSRAAVVADRDPGEGIPRGGTLRP